MEFSLSQQAGYFLASIGLGAAMAMIYDLIRAIRMLTRSSHLHVLISDVLFFFVCGVLTSLFALPFNRGDVRAFMLFGEAVGFLTYRLTLGSIFGKFYAALARLLRHFIRKICEKLKKIYDFLLKAGAILLYNIGDLIGRVCRTAISGLRVLYHERRASRVSRRAERVRSRPTRSRAASAGTPHIAYYQIPLFGDRMDHIRNEYDQKRPQTRKKRKKNAKNTIKRRR